MFMRALRLQAARVAQSVHDHVGHNKSLHDVLGICYECYSQVGHTKSLYEC